MDRQGLDLAFPMKMVCGQEDARLASKPKKLLYGLSNTLQYKTVTAIGEMSRYMLLKIYNSILYVVVKAPTDFLFLTYLQNVAFCFQKTSSSELNSLTV